MTLKTRVTIKVRGVPLRIMRLTEKNEPKDDVYINIFYGSTSDRKNGMEDRISLHFSPNDPRLCAVKRTVKSKNQDIELMKWSDAVKCENGFVHATTVILPGLSPKDPGLVVRDNEHEVALPQGEFDPDTETVALAIFVGSKTARFDVGNPNFQQLKLESRKFQIMIVSRILKSQALPNGIFCTKYTKKIPIEFIGRRARKKMEMALVGLSPGECMEDFVADILMLKRKIEFNRPRLLASWIASGEEILQNPPLGMNLELIKESLPRMREDLKNSKPSPLYVFLKDPVLAFLEAQYS